jgi:aminoglycoside phosphotransferase (APT) family kinase protein
VARAFALSGEVAMAEIEPSGHINDSYVVTCRDGGQQSRFVLQRINHFVFRRVPELMENVVRVTEHLRHHQARRPGQRALELMPVRAGGFVHCDVAGNWWRVYRFLEGTHTGERVVQPAQARAAAEAFGDFQRLLNDLPGPRLHETIPGFHHTRRRFEALQRAVSADALGRVPEARDVINAALARESMVDVFQDLQASGRMPERCVHNDTKLANVMFDGATGAAVCVIDLDTVMPGLAPNDFGEMVRSGANPGAEDAREVAGLEARRPIFEALLEGYLASAGSFLTATEREFLPFAGRLMTYENGIRFLADFLEGDVYYKISRPGQNFDRARNQFALLASLEAQQEDFAALVRKMAGS